MASSGQRGDVVSTFSILAVEKRTGALGVAVATGSTYVADRVPHVEPGVGAVATQGYTRVSYGPEGLGLLRRGFPPDEALRVLLRADPGREMRQVGILDASGRGAAHTGTATPRWHGHIIEPGCIVLGNLIAGREVLEAMLEAFRAHMEAGDGLGWSLLMALEAGARAGGDLRGERSAALLVTMPRGPVLKLRADDEARPVEALKALWRGGKARRAL